MPRPSTIALSLTLLAGAGAIAQPDSPDSPAASIPSVVPDGTLRAIRAGDHDALLIRWPNDIDHAFAKQTLRALLLTAVAGSSSDSPTLREARHEQEMVWNHISPIARIAVVWNTQFDSDFASSDGIRLAEFTTGLSDDERSAVRREVARRFLALLSDHDRLRRNYGERRNDARRGMRPSTPFSPTTDPREIRDPDERARFIRNRHALRQENLHNAYHDLGELMDHWFIGSRASPPGSHIAWYLGSLFRSASDADRDWMAHQIQRSLPRDDPRVPTMLEAIRAAPVNAQP